MKVRTPVRVPLVVLLVLGGCTAADELAGERVENVPTRAERVEAPASAAPVASAEPVGRDAGMASMPDPEEPADYAGVPDCEQASARLVQLAGDESRRAGWLDDCRHAWTAKDRRCVVGAQDWDAAARCRAL